MTRFSFLCLLYISTASAQSIWVGVKGGLPLTQAFNAIENPQPLTVTAFYQNSEGLLAFDYDSATQRKIPYTVGPAVEIRLWRHIRVEADGLYSRAVYDYTSVRFDKFTSNSYFDALKHAVDRVDTPVLVKYEFAERRRFHPFAGAGGSIRYSHDKVLQGIADAAVPGGGTEYSTPPTIFNSSLGTPIQVVAVRALRMGPAFSAGVETPVGRHRASAEIRYTRYPGDSINAPALHSNLNQVDLMAGIVF
jgi:hypothetical protein